MREPFNPNLSKDLSATPRATGVLFAALFRRFDMDRKPALVDPNLAGELLALAGRHSSITSANRWQSGHVGRSPPGPGQRL
jgi:hypothetical protein